MADNRENIYLFGEFQFDAAEFILRRGEQEIPLPPKVLDVLSFMRKMENYLLRLNKLYAPVPERLFPSKNGENLCWQ